MVNIVLDSMGVRVHIDKVYFTLPEVLDRWRISEADVVYLAENDSLRLSVRVFGVPVEFGDYEDMGDGRQDPRLSADTAPNALHSDPCRRAPRAC